MDMAFLLRSRRLLDGRQTARLDHQLLQAMLATGRAMPASVARADAIDEEPLIELMAAGPDWRRAAARQHGCFNRAEAGRARNGA